MKGLIKRISKTNNHLFFAWGYFQVHITINAKLIFWTPVGGICTNYQTEMSQTVISFHFLIFGVEIVIDKLIKYALQCIYHDINKNSIKQVIEPIIKRQKQ